MDFLTAIQPILDYGLAPALLLLFVKYFFDKDKARETQINELNAQFEKREQLLRTDMERRETQYKERERIIVAENAEREELIKKESEKREKLIIEAAEKREASLLEIINSFRETIDGFKKVIKEIPSSMNQLQQKIDSIGDTIGKLN